MGQYYRPIVLKKNWKTAKQPVETTLCPYDYDNGAKLMEHSYVGNGFVAAMLYLVANYHYGKPFVWCGDYADEPETHEHKEGVNLYCEACELEDNKGLNPNIPEFKDIPNYKYIINLTKKVYVEVPECDPNKWQVHPLPLLTAYGNGRGCGDYRINDERVGSWAFDKIGVSNNEGDVEGLKKVSGYFKLDF